MGGLPFSLSLLALLSGLMYWAFRTRGRRTQALQEYLQGFPAPDFLPNPEPPIRLPGRWRTRGLLALCAGGFVVLAWMGIPLGTRRLPVRVNARPVILLVDVSRSMEVQDVPFGRLASARLLARRVVSQLRGNPVGLLAVAGETHSLLPVTHDRAFLFQTLDALDSRVMTDPGTVLTGALREAMVLMEGETGLREPVFILFSDGEAHEGASELLSLASQVEEKGGQIYTISVGTEGGGVVPSYPQTSPILMSPARQADTEDGIPYSRAQPDLLRSVAEAGGGVFAQGDDPAGMTSFLAEAKSWGPTDGGISWETRPIEGWPLFICLALGFLFLEMLLGSVLPVAPDTGIVWVGSGSSDELV